MPQFLLDLCFTSPPPRLDKTLGKIKKSFFRVPLSCSSTREKANNCFGDADWA